jgi:hypothetical protein
MGFNAEHLAEHPGSQTTTKATKKRAPKKGAAEAEPSLF